MKCRICKLKSCYDRPFPRKKKAAFIGGLFIKNSIKKK